MTPPCKQPIMDDQEKPDQWPVVIASSPLDRSAWSRRCVIASLTRHRCTRELSRDAYTNDHCLGPLRLNAWSKIQYIGAVAIDAQAGRAL